MSDEESLEEYAAQIRSEAEKAGISISDEHARLAAEWRGTYEAAVKAIRAMDYSSYEPGAVFVPVTELSTPPDTEL